MTSESDELRRLRAENARLRTLLDAHGIYDPPRKPALVEQKSVVTLTPNEKVALFRRLFRGRTDVYPVRWENKSGKSGYAPACGNEWRPGVCEKPRIKCADCVHRSFLEVSDQVIYAHLSGQHTVGIYPLLPDDTCYFVAVDFDEADWREDALAFMASCRTLDIPASLEISRSGNGAHVWIFFESAVLARDARRLATAIISHVCARTRQLQLTSYDRIFPNQDTLPKGGYGNLIALPLQRGPREAGWSVFVDENLCPYPDQWAYLESVSKMPTQHLEDATMRASGGGHPLDVTFVSPEASIQDVFVQLTGDAARTELIASEINENYLLGRKILVLTERTDHLDMIRQALPNTVSTVFVLHGRMPKKEREATVAELSNLPPEAPRVLIATGKLLGEGFDHAALDTLILAMPISWRGTLQQYAGRLHRNHGGKSDVRIFDFVDTCHPALGRMWRKRQHGYRAMGYRIEAA